MVPPALYESETWNMRVVEIKKLNVMKMRCLKSMYKIAHLDRVRNGEVRRRTGMVRELADRAEHVEIMDEERLVKR